MDDYHSFIITQKKNPTEETHKQPAHKKIGVAVLLLATYNTPDGLWGRKILIWNNRRRAPTALLMLQRCIELDLKKIIAIIGLFQSFSIAKIFQRFFQTCLWKRPTVAMFFFKSNSIHRCTNSAVGALLRLFAAEHALTMYYKEYRYTY